MRTPRRRRWRRRGWGGAVHVGSEREEQFAESRARSVAATCARRQAAATLRPPLFLQPVSPSAPRPHGRASMSVLDLWATAAGGRTLAGLWRLCILVVQGARPGRAGVVYTADHRRQTTRP